MRKLNYSLIDVFTERPLSGAPLAVFTLSAPLPAPTMQQLAREMNLAETAFVTPSTERGSASLRVFSPREERDDVGHAAIGAAYVIGRSAPLGHLRFKTPSGDVDVFIEREGGFVSRCVMVQRAPTFREVDGAAVGAALGVAVRGAVFEGSNGITSLLARVDDVDAVTPDAKALTQLPFAVAVYEGSRDNGTGGRVARQRLFAPDERPASGPLAGLVAQRLLLDGDTQPGVLSIRQGEHLERPAVIDVWATHDQTPRVGGACASVARGTFELPYV